MPLPSYAKQYIPLFEAALAEEIGLYIETDRRQSIVHTLYDLRKEDPRFADLAIISPIIEGRDGVVFLAKKTTELVDE
jgi:hypothetical protein